MRDKYEKKHMGGYEKIFPIDDDEEKMARYKEMIMTSMKVYMEENNSVRNRMQ